MLSEKYTSENDTIYYELVANDAPLPEAKCLMKSVPFEPPQKQEIIIIQTKGSDCTLM